MKEILISCLLSGLVVDSETKEPIPAARIEVVGEASNNYIYTDFDGNFELDSLNDTTKIMISFVSYQDTVLTYGDIKKSSVINLTTY
jgi:hypothetical protein